MKYTLSSRHQDYKVLFTFSKKIGIFSLGAANTETTVFHIIYIVPGLRTAPLDPGTPILSYAGNENQD